MVPVLNHKNRILRIDNSPLVTNAVAETYLTAATVGGTTSALTVRSITGFNVSSIILLGELGAEDAEIVLAHAATTPSVTADVGTITLTAALVKTHPVGTRVRCILFNQFELSNATTASGSKTVLTVANGHPTSGLGTGLVAVDATQIVQSYEDREYTTGYYFARYKDSVGAVFGSYTDALPYGGWTKSYVGYMIERALKDCGLLSLSVLVSINDCFEWLTECLNEINGKIKHWPEHYSYNTIIGQTSRGVNVITMPTDAYDTETNKSVFAVRVGDSKNLTYLDPALFDAQLESVNVTTTRSSTSSGATSINLTNSYDFDDSGSVNVYVSGTLYTITYTGVTRDTSSGATGALTGVPTSGTGSVSVTIPSGTYVWQNETEGTPEVFTVRNGSFEFWPLADSAHDNFNAYMDYAKVATSIDSQGDTIDYQRYDMVQSYLTWRMRMKANNIGKLDQNDGDYLKYKEKMNDAIRTLGSPNVYRARPSINRMSKGPSRLKANLQDLPYSQQ